jgi:predicted dinucleotide-binding enzyme
MEQAVRIAEVVLREVRTTQAVNLNLKMNAALEDKIIYNVICV